MTLQAFYNNLNQTYLQRHLLAMPILTIEDAVRAVNESLQIKPGYGHLAQAIQDEEKLDVNRAHPALAFANGEMNKAIIELLTKLTSQLEKLQQSSSSRLSGSGDPKRDENNAAPVCRGCNRPGYQKNICPINRWLREAQTRPGPGNERDQQQ